MTRPDSPDDGDRRQALRQANDERRRWQRVEEALADALELDPRDRAAYVERLDVDVREEVADLVNAADSPPTVMSRDSLFDDGVPTLEGTRLGSYRLGRLLGRGGMGEVYLAQRVEGDFEQQVAVKVMAHGPRALESRFLRERRILAALDHPGIAGIQDGGRLADGRPYFVMPYVEGVPLTEASQGLDLEGRLRLLLQVVDLVAFAHRNLVVHRDLKPSNILVGDDGRATLLDFGIAKLLDDEANGDGDRAGDPNLLTTRGSNYFTVVYAAPEQLRVERVSVQTDVYALGVLLYELVAGSAPFVETGIASFDLARRICDQDPPPPSRETRLRDRRLSDVDAIALKCLRKRPEDRYESVAALGDDLRACLQLRPVRAREGSRRYLASRFLLRHWAAALAVLVVVGALALGTVVAVAGQRRAERESARAQAVAEALGDVFELTDPDLSAGGLVSAADLLGAGVQKARALEDQPHTEASLLSIVAAGYRRLGMYDEGREAAQRSLELYRRLGSETSDEAREVLLELAEIERLAARFDEAEAIYDELLDSGETRPSMLSDIWNGLGLLAYERGDFAAATAQWQRSLDLSKQAEPAGGPLTARALSNLADGALSENDREGAELLLRESLAMLERTVGEKNSDTVTVLSNLARVVKAGGDLEAARPLYVRVLELRRRLYGEGHPRVAQATNNLATVEYAAGDFVAAGRTFQQALDFWLLSLPADHPDVLGTRTNLAMVELRLGHHDEAIRHLEEILRRTVEHYGADHAQVPVAECRLAKAEVAAGRLAAALVRLERILPHLESDWGAEYRSTLDARGLRAEALAGLGRCEEASTELARVEQADAKRAAKYNPAVSAACATK